MGIEYPYTSRVIFPDGRTVEPLPWLEMGSEEAYGASLPIVEEMIQDRVADCRFVLDQLQWWNEPGSTHLLAGRMDLAKVGAFGHSFSGAMAGRVVTRTPAKWPASIWTGGFSRDPLRIGVAKPFFLMNNGDGGRPDCASVEAKSGRGRISAAKDLTDWLALETTL